MSITPISPVEVSSQEILNACSPSDQVADTSLAATRAPALAGALDFSRRADLIEMMDQPCSYEELRACLHDIARVNRLTFAQRPTLGWLAELVAAHPVSGAPLRIVDVGCGYGDTLRRIDRWAAKRGVAVMLTGIDLNPDAIRAAREATSANQKIEWLVGDALADHTKGPIDVVICSLLTHHLTDSQVVLFLRWMDQTARRGWFIDDLHRKPVPYHLFRLWARLSNWHEFVKHDGPVSIRRSFVAEDWQRLCAGAEIAADTVSITEHRPARLCVGRIK
ncbi:methyltransferase domain-containing protein [Granulicella sp. S190]|uniref:methyltransferase domain-containing protein n=1 Tax=Granulicella sp. S190 TaxID=1747226 RepID=UPI0020B121AD|nr:methyltransferase domain-containing protein [Granulicella sp. S190]